jgi:hypothetical protein
MSVFLLILKAVVTFIVLMYVSLNLIGIVVRSIFIRGAKMNDYDKEVKLIVELNYNKKSILFGIIISVIILFLFYFISITFHWGYALASLIIMYLRVPDLLWEIKKNRKITKEYAPITSFFNTSLNIILNIVSFLIVVYALLQH